jgi:WD40 repeat protein
VAVHELGFSKDGKLLASAAADRTVRLWNGSSGAAQQTIQVGSITYAVALNPDGKCIAAGGFDGFVRLFQVAGGRALVTLLALPPRGETSEWLAATPEGYVASSPGLADLGHWRMGGQPVAAQRVWEQLSQPDAVARAFRGEKLLAPTFEK